MPAKCAGSWKATAHARARMSMASAHSVDTALCGRSWHGAYLGYVEAIDAAPRGAVRLTRVEDGQGGRRVGLVALELRGGDDDEPDTLAMERGACEARVGFCTDAHAAQKLGLELVGQQRVRVRHHLVAVCIHEG